MGYTLNFSAVWRSFDHLLWGLGLSLVLAVVAIGIGCAIGLFVAFGQISRQRVISALSDAYVTAFRNTPLLVLVLFAFFALPQLGLRLSKIELIRPRPRHLCRRLSRRGLPRRPPRRSRRA